jgi:hypothetical protein
MVQTTGRDARMAALSMGFTPSTGDYPRSIHIRGRTRLRRDGARVGG